MLENIHGQWAMFNVVRSAVEKTLCFKGVTVICINNNHLKALSTLIAKGVSKRNDKMYSMNVELYQIFSLTIQRELFYSPELRHHTLVKVLHASTLKSISQ